MSNLMDVPKCRLRTHIRNNINSANLPSRRSPVSSCNPLIKEIIKEFGTPVGPRYKVKNLNVFFQNLQLLRLELFQLKMTQVCL
jgi:hypothetical protein